ncbi:hypothetical protein GCM10010307_16790 [Streptomyces vastus]|uniref:ArsR family transcriptional regulator n=1 Tax=Streptomyces vastus TaxID=285451 RepID=A0ABP6CYE6_9ACTN
MEREDQEGQQGASRERQHDPVLGLAPSSVSAHLSALRAAGLLVSRRYGHQVLYERTPLGMALASGGT